MSMLLKKGKLIKSEECTGGLVFSASDNAGKVIFSIYNDGTVVLPEESSKTEASIKFWQALSYYFPDNKNIIDTNDALFRCIAAMKAVASFKTKEGKEEAEKLWKDALSRASCLLNSENF